MDTSDHNYEQNELNQTLSKEAQNKQPLNAISSEPVAALNYATLQQIAIFKYGSVGRFAASQGWGRNMGSRLLSGSYIPRKVSTIKKIAEALGLEVVTLTQFFDRQLYSKQGEEKNGDS